MKTPRPAVGGPTAGGRFGGWFMPGRGRMARRLRRIGAPPPGEAMETRHGAAFKAQGVPMACRCSGSLRFPSDRCRLSFPSGSFFLPVLSSLLLIRWRFLPLLLFSSGPVCFRFLYFWRIFSGCKGRPILYAYNIIIR